MLEELVVCGRVQLYYAIILMATIFCLCQPLLDIVSLKLFEDFLGLKSHLFEEFRPRKSSKRCYFRSLKLTYFEGLLFCHLCLLLIALPYISI